MHTSNKYSSNPMWIASGVTTNRQLGLYGRGLSWRCKFSRPRFRLSQLVSVRPNLTALIISARPNLSLPP
jgi:hypothetical protein